MGCYIWYSEEGPEQAAAPPSPLLAVPNVTAHSLTASVPITVLLYDGPLLCGFNVAIKGFIMAAGCAEIHEPGNVDWKTTDLAGHIQRDVTNLSFASNSTDPIWQIRQKPFQFIKFNDIPIGDYPNTENLKTGTNPYP